MIAAVYTVHTDMQGANAYISRESYRVLTINLLTSISKYDSIFM